MIENLTIGQLATAADVNVETVRYYERRGLIEQPEKPPQGFRRYPQNALHRILFIKRSQELGFTLVEITNLLLLGDSHCSDVQDLAESKLKSVRSRLDDLHRLEHVLNTFVVKCQSNSDSNHCPIIESLVSNTYNS